MKKVFYLACFVVIAAITVFAILVYLEAQKPGDYDAFAKCLNENGFVMAGTDWCHFCQNQKRLFGNSFKFVNYKNCDLERQWCSSHGVEGYPAWFDSEGNSYSGVKQLSFLSELSGCPLGE